MIIVLSSISMDSMDIRNEEQDIKKLYSIISKISKYYEKNQFNKNYDTKSIFLNIRENEKLSTSEHMTMIFK